MIGSNDSKINMFCIISSQSGNTPTHLMEICGHSAEVTSLRFSNKSLSFLSGSKDGKLKVWTLRNKKWTAATIDL